MPFRLLCATSNVNHREAFGVIDMTYGITSTPCYRPHKSIDMLGKIVVHLTVSISAENLIRVYVELGCGIHSR